MTTHFLECNPIVTVRDLDLAKQFYLDVLGFSVDFETEDVIGLLQNKVLILIIGHDSVNARQKPGSSNISFLTDEVDSLFDRCSSAGVAVLVEPVDRPYGQRDFAIRDPDGNVLSFGCALAD